MCRGFRRKIARKKRKKISMMIIKIEKNRKKLFDEVILCWRDLMEYTQFNRK